MASVPSPTPEFNELARKTFRFDWVTSLMLAMIVMSGAIVTWLTAVYITNQVWMVKTPAVPIEIIEILSEDLEGMAGDEPELGENQMVTPDELPPREEELIFESPEVANVMANVLDSIAEHEADFADPKRQQGKQAAGRTGKAGGEGREGTGTGSGAIPRAQRWVINYPRNQTLDTYSQQLDFFRIELGVIRGNQLTNVSNFSRGRPIAKRGGADENRLYFMWRDEARRAVDRSLLARAGVATQNAIIVQFYPEKLEQLLAQLEQKFAGRKPEEIRMTRFGIRPAGSGYEFYVMEQTGAKP
jgi:hypothetical protein